MCTASFCVGVCVCLCNALREGASSCWQQTKGGEVNLFCSALGTCKPDCVMPPTCATSVLQSSSKNTFYT